MRITYGTNSFNSDNYVGWTVAEFVGNAAIQSLFNLSGDESVEVRSDGGSFRTVSSSYVFGSNDEVQLFRNAGTKGL